MTWTWRLERNDGTVLTEPTVPAFDSQVDAETWVGDEWQSLLAAGVDSVTLMEDDDVIYDGMSLHPPEE
ncbi:MAG: hypothetical protein ACK5MR_01115 [Cumulibacter sp.]|uniref:hypothetical protein n=1 Tax=Cumulibacter soli TaxID=2546344 RepID=UPI0010682FA6|nr:hypothetical protein [Cumulibacter soli]